MDFITLESGLGTIVTMWDISGNDHPTVEYTIVTFSVY